MKKAPVTPAEICEIHAFVELGRLVVSTLNKANKSKMEMNVLANEDGTKIHQF